MSTAKKFCPCCGKWKPQSSFFGYKKRVTITCYVCRISDDYRTWTAWIKRTGFRMTLSEFKVKKPIARWEGLRAYNRFEDPEAHNFTIDF